MLPIFYPPTGELFSIWQCSPASDIAFRKLYIGFIDSLKLRLSSGRLDRFVALDMTLDGSEHGFKVRSWFLYRITSLIVISDHFETRAIMRHAHPISYLAIAREPLNLMSQ